MGNTVCLLDRFGSGCYAGMHLILDCLGAMLDVTRFIVSLYFTTLATAALVAAMVSRLRSSTPQNPWVLILASRISFGLRILKRTRVARSRPVV